MLRFDVLIPTGRRGSGQEIWQWARLLSILISATAVAFALLTIMVKICCWISRTPSPWQTAMDCSLTMENGSEFEPQLNLSLKSGIRIPVNSSGLPGTWEIGIYRPKSDIRFFVFGRTM